MAAAVHVYDTLGVHPVDSHAHDVAIDLDLIRDRIKHQHRRRHWNAASVRRLERILRRHMRASFLRERPAGDAARHREETLRDPRTLDRGSGLHWLGSAAAWVQQQWPDGAISFGQLAAEHDVAAFRRIHADANRVADANGILGQPKRSQSRGRSNFDDLVNGICSVRPNGQIGMWVLPSEVRHDALDDALLRHVKHRRAVMSEHWAGDG